MSVIELREAYFHSGVRLPAPESKNAKEVSVASSGTDYINHIHTGTKRFMNKFRLFYDGERVFVYAVPGKGQVASSPAIVSNTNIRYVRPLENCVPGVFVGVSNHNASKKEVDLNEEGNCEDDSKDVNKAQKGRGQGKNQGQEVSQ